MRSLIEKQPDAPTSKRMQSPIEKFSHRVHDLESLADLNFSTRRDRGVEREIVDIVRSMRVLRTAADELKQLDFSGNNGLSDNREIIYRNRTKDEVEFRRSLSDIIQEHASEPGTHVQKLFSASRTIIASIKNYQNSEGRAPLPQLFKMRAMTSMVSALAVDLVHAAGLPVDQLRYWVKRILKDPNQAITELHGSATKLNCSDSTLRKGRIIFLENFVAHRKDAIESLERTLVSRFAKVMGLEASQVDWPPKDKVRSCANILVGDPREKLSLSERVAIAYNDLSSHHGRVDRELLNNLKLATPSGRELSNLPKLIAFSVSLQKAYESSYELDGKQAEAQAQHRKITIEAGQAFLKTVGDAAIGECPLSNLSKVGSNLTSILDLHTSSGIVGALPASERIAKVHAYADYCKDKSPDQWIEGSPV